MAFKTFKSSFISGHEYLIHQQQHGYPFGGSLLLNRRFQYRHRLHRKDLYAHYGCVNAIEFSNDGERMISGGDDRRVLLWNMSQALTATPKPYLPQVMKSQHNSNIFCVAFNMSHTKILSAGNDHQVILHDIATKESLDVFQHPEAVYGLSADPSNDDLFVTSCKDGHVLLWDLRQSYDPIVLAKSVNAYHDVMHNPVEPNYLATANAREGVCLRDIRNPITYVIKYGSSVSTNAMSVRFNRTGNQLLVLRRRHPPVIYSVTSSDDLVEFFDKGYFNSCTVKSCCFAGDKDQYVISGSDDFHLYVWKIPDVSYRNKITVADTHMKLIGHRSVVNQVRFNNSYGVIASSGVEKIIKLWSSFSLTNSKQRENIRREAFSDIEYVNLLLHNNQFTHHDYSDQSTREDPAMIAFFDSLIRNDVNQWTSDSENENSENSASGEDLAYVVQSSASPSSISASASDEELESIVEMNPEDPLYNCDIRPSGEAPCPHTSESIEEGTSINGVSFNNQSVESSPSNNFLRIESPISRAPTRRENPEVSASRRLFSDGTQYVGNGLLMDPDRVFSQYIASTRREGAMSRLFTDREEAANYIQNSRNNVTNGKSPSVSSSDEDTCIHPSSLRISELIAEKRRINELKNARKSMKKEKILHKRPKKRQTPTNRNYIKDRYCVIRSTLNTNTSYKTLNVDISSQKNPPGCNNKINKLRKKRARLIKDPRLDDTSSDSDDASKISSPKNEVFKSIGISNNVTNGDKKTNTLDQPSTSGTQSSVISNDSLKVSFSKKRRLRSSSISKDLNVKDPNYNCDIDSASEKNKVDAGSSSFQNLNGISCQNGTSEISEYSSALLNEPPETVAALRQASESSGSTSCVPVSVVKFARNYRKRSAEDSDDD